MSVRAEDRAQLSAFLDGELDEATAARVRARLARDADYARALEELERVDSALRAIPTASVSAELAGRMRERLAAEGSTAEVVPLRRPPTARRRRSGPWLYAAAALAATLALALLLRGQLVETPERPIAERSVTVPQSGMEGVDPAAEPEGVAPLPLEASPTAERVAEGVRPRAPAEPAPGPERIAEVPAPAPRAGSTVPTPDARAGSTVPAPDASPAPERVAVAPQRSGAPAPEAGAEPPDVIAAATDEELLLVLGLEAYGADANELEDLAIIEQLELLELLERLAAGERRG